ncbi:MAG: serine hydrolase domain-containing protein, partial [Solirubrobacteraceae bacterium]
DNADGDDGDIADSFGADLIFGARSADMATAAAEVPLVHAPGAYWAYSTATSMIVAGIVARNVGGNAKRMVAFMRREVFEPIGMTTAVPEFDAAGNFMGGAFVHASAHDWARFGYLYLHDGVWDGKRILPVGWVEFSRTRAPAENNRTYGAHFWLNGEPGEGQLSVLPGGPADAFEAEGSNGQIVDIVPSRELVVVRLGELQGTDWRAMKRSLSRLVMAFPPVAAPGATP